MAEVEVGGVTFKGGKAFGIILAIGSMTVSYTHLTLPTKA